MTEDNEYQSDSSKESLLNNSPAFQDNENIDNKLSALSFLFNDKDKIKRRRKKFRYERIIWDDHVRELLYRK